MSAERFGRRQSRSLLWMVSGQIVWALHFLGVYIGMSLGCAMGYAPLQWGGLPAINVALLIFTLPLLALIVYLGWASWRYWRRLRDLQQPGQRIQTPAFMALAATLIHAISLLAVAWVALPLLLSPPCV